MNILNIVRCICLVFVILNQGVQGYINPTREVPIPCCLRNPSTSGPLPERFIIGRIVNPSDQQCLVDIDEALARGANPNCAIDVSRFGLGSLTPMEIALKRTDCGLLGVLLRHGVPLTGDQVIANCVNAKHGSNMPLLIKLVASTAPVMEQAQCREVLRNHPQVLAARK